MNDNDKPNKNIGHTKEIFEEKFGNMENFSRQAVGKLFDEEKKEETDTAQPPYKRMSRSAEAEYEAYLNSASAENRREMLKKKAEKDAALALRESHLSELPKSRKQAEEQVLDKELERAEVYAISQVGKNKIKPEQTKKPVPPLNYRNIAAAGLAFFLLLLAVMIFWLASMNSRLQNSTNQVEEMQGIQNALELEIADLAWQLELAQATTLPAVTLPDVTYNEDENDNGEDSQAGDTQQGQATTQAPAGPRIHVVEPNQTLWAINAIYFGNVNRIADIMALNNIANADEIGAGDELFIPH